MALGNTNY